MPIFIIFEIVLPGDRHLYFRGTDFQFCIFGSDIIPGDRHLYIRTALAERHCPFLSEHDYGIKGLTGLLEACSSARLRFSTSFYFPNTIYIHSGSIVSDTFSNIASDIYLSLNVSGHSKYRLLTGSFIS